MEHEPIDQGDDVIVEFECPSCRLRNTFLGCTKVFVYTCGRCCQQVDIRALQMHERGEYPPKPPADDEPTEAVTSHVCPHCGHHNVFVGWSQMFAYVCQKCGKGVKVEGTVH